MLGDTLSKHSAIYYGKALGLGSLKKPLDQSRFRLRNSPSAGELSMAAIIFSKSSVNGLSDAASLCASRFL
jgi:hypothetical protein